MKNTQKGFIIPIIIATVALLAIGGGVYIYTNNKVEAPELEKKITPNNNESNKIILKFQPVEGHIPIEPVNWSVNFYGPDNKKEKLWEEIDILYSIKKDITEDEMGELYRKHFGFHKKTEGALAETIIIELEENFVGQLTLSASYKADTGKTVLGEKSIIADRPPGKMIGIKPKSGSNELHAGPTVPLSILAVYDSGQEYEIFVNHNEIKYESENSEIANISSRSYFGESEARIDFLSPGTTRIKVTYKDTYVGYSTIKVIEPWLIITSPDKFELEFNKPFSYQITADGVVSEYIASNLPKGLELNKETGLISGTPTEERHYYSEIEVVNTDGENTRQTVEFTIRDVNKPPTKVYLGNVNSPASLQYKDKEVGSLTTLDENAPDKHTYEFVEGVGDDNNGLFRIVNNYYLCTNEALSPDKYPSLSIRIRTTDDRGLSFEGIIEMNNSKKLEYNDYGQHNPCEK